jgi:hypothetical protein
VSGFKRRAEVPLRAHRLNVSKADLLEAAWHLASICNEAGSCDDETSTYLRLVEELNAARARNGRQRVRTTRGKTPSMDAELAVEIIPVKAEAS